MKKYIPILISLVPLGLVILVGWLAWRFFFSAADSVVKDVAERQQEAVKETSSEMMLNGYKYIDFSRMLLDTMFSRGFAGHLFFSVDQETLGKLCQAIQPGEFARLEQIWPIAKEVRNNEYGTAFVLGSGGTLREDLNRSLSNANRLKYASHLPL